MTAKLEYDSDVERLNSATAAALVVGAIILIFATASSHTVVAQINGTPASVTSINSGGRFTSAPGVPASVTSLAPNGLGPTNQFFPPSCCINPLFPLNPNPPMFQRHHHQRGSFFPGGGLVYVPYPVAGEPEMADTPFNPVDDYRGGPTIFDRRGSGQGVSSYLDDYPRRANRSRSEAAETEPAQPAQAADNVVVPDQPQTVLVFKDGHQAEVQNYAVVGSLLYDLTPGRHRKIAIADLDLQATAKQNDDLGISFQLPPAPGTGK